MSSVATYVFLDLETTGIPRQEYNKTKIIEISLVAVKRKHLLDTRAGAVPRVQQKLTLCFNPQKMIADEGSKVTGLCNFLLENEPIFDIKAFSLIDTFLSILTQPVCFIAQNGITFDYPILRSHLVKLKVEFSSEILCADCLLAFYDILECLKTTDKDINVLTENIQSEELAPNYKVPMIPENQSQNISNENKYEETVKTMTEGDVIDFHAPHTSMQAINERTPKSSRVPRVHKVTNAKRQLFWGNGPKPKVSYKLKDIYKRVLNRPAMDAHRAENDCIFALEVSVALAKQFVEWVDNNHVKFTDIKPMTVGVW